MDLKSYIRVVKNFPKPGIEFLDITTLLESPKAFSYAIELLIQKLKEADYDKIAALDARGFIFAAVIAEKLQKPLVLIRKHGKLPHDTAQVSYQLEYGADIIEVHKSSIDPGDRIALVDDLIATGGTIKAACELMEQRKAEVVSINVLMTLDYLPYQERLANYLINSVLRY
jgi:adenine phosphoribosyltransferase